MATEFPRNFRFRLTTDAAVNQSVAVDRRILRTWSVDKRYVLCQTIPQTKRNWFNEINQPINTVLLSVTNVDSLYIYIGK